MSKEKKKLAKKEEEHAERVVRGVFVSIVLLALLSLIAFSFLGG
jgi:heme/copper-type cytochrome/quinol oxidase subunit 4